MHDLSWIGMGLVLWAGLAMAAEQKAPSASATKTVVYRADRDWVAIRWSPEAVKKHSALDFSVFQDAPAGKYGDVMIRNGKFSFARAPEKVVRFYGVNLTHESPFLTHADSEKLADKLASEGFNLVRLHLNERWLTVRDGATVFNPGQKDKMDYLLSCLRKKGIYYVMTIYSGAYFTPGAVRDVPEFARKGFRFEMKVLALISDDAMNYMRQYARVLLGSVNPYTGLAPKDDPALVGVELTNENPTNRLRLEYPEFTPIFTRRCREYLTERDGRVPSEAEVTAFYNRFQVLLLSRFYQTMKTFLRRELGLSKPLSDVNCRSSLGFTPVRNEFDYVDVHAYWDLYKYTGAEFGGGMFSKGKKYIAYRLRYLDPLAGLWASQLEAGVPRIFGKPFACGEFNMCYPAPDRLFTVPLQSVLAGVQGWDMIMHYCYSSRPEFIVRTRPERRLQISGSPLALLSERIGFLMFARHEISEAPLAIPLVLTSGYIDEKLKTQDTLRPPADYYRLGFSCRIGTVLADDRTDLSRYPCVVIPADLEKLPAGLQQVRYFRAGKGLAAALREFLPGGADGLRLSSAGQQIVLDSQKSLMAVSTPRSECLLLAAKTPAAAGRFMTVSGNATEATCFAASLDGRPLARSSRILLLYLTDLKNTGTEIEFGGPNGWPIVRQEGDLPHLVRQGTVSLAFNAAARPLPRVWTLKFNGERHSELRPEKTEHGFKVKLQAVAAPDAYCAYEMCW